VVFLTEQRGSVLQQIKSKTLIAPL